MTNSFQRYQSLHHCFPWSDFVVVMHPRYCSIHSPDVFAEVDPLLIIHGQCPLAIKPMLLSPRIESERHNFVCIYLQGPMVRSTAGGNVL